MQKSTLLIALLVIAAAVLAGVTWWLVRDSNKTGNPNTANQLPTNHPTAMRIISPAFEANQAIPSRFTCDKENINPPLDFEQVPPKAKTLALIMDDPDAPAGTFTHWLIWNLPINSAIQENSPLPAGAQSGLNDGGQTAYFGPCPPNGKHRYFFKLFALDSKLDLPKGAKREQLEKAMADHTIARAELMGTYSR